MNYQNFMLSDVGDNEINTIDGLILLIKNSELSKYDSEYPNESGLQGIVFSRITENLCLF